MFLCNITTVQDFIPTITELLEAGLLFINLQQVRQLVKTR